MVMKGLLWLSIATTGPGKGLDFTTALPTEIAFILTDFGMRPIEGYYDRLLLTRRHAEILKESPETLRVLKEEKALHPKHPEAVSLAEAEQNIIDMLKEHVGDSEVTLAALGSAHYALPVLQTHLPRLAQRLTFYSLDVSQIVRWTRFAGGLSALRREAPDMSEFEEAFAMMPPYSASTLRKTLTEAVQFRNLMSDLS